MSSHVCLARSRSWWSRSCTFSYGVPFALPYLCLAALGSGCRGVLATLPSCMHAPARLHTPAMPSRHSIFTSSLGAQGWSRARLCLQVLCEWRTSCLPLPLCRASYWALWPGMLYALRMHLLFACCCACTVGVGWYILDLKRSIALDLKGNFHLRLCVTVYFKF